MDAYLHYFAAIMQIPDAINQTIYCNCELPHFNLASCLSCLHIEESIDFSREES